MASISLLMSTDLPPEAYTRETLQAAFDWLQSQPDLVRTSVHTPERLVALYQKSQRLNDNDRPVSSKKFITDLKNLATSLDEFSGPSSSPMPSRQFSSPVTASVLESEPEPKPAQSSKKTTQTVKKASFEVTTNTTTSDDDVLALDKITQERIQKVQRRFNLGSEAEATRLLISLGYEKFSTFE